VLVLMTFIPIAFLPRKRQPAKLDDPSGESGGQEVTPAMIH
jgi:hypothetical protein